MSDDSSDLIDLESLEEKPKEKSQFFQVTFNEKAEAKLSVYQLLSMYFRCDKEYTMSGNWFHGFKLLYQWLGPCLPLQDYVGLDPIPPRFVVWEFQQVARILDIDYRYVHRFAWNFFKEKEYGDVF